MEKFKSELLILAAVLAMFTTISGDNGDHLLPEGYRKEVLMDLCQFIGVRYVRDPDNQECGYITCWEHKPYHMSCSPGLKVHLYFQWGDTYPCTENDTLDQCGYLKLVAPEAHRIEPVSQKTTDSSSVRNKLPSKRPRIRPNMKSFFPLKRLNRLRKP